MKENKIITSVVCSNMESISLFKEAQEIIKNWYPKTSEELNNIISLGNILIELKYIAAIDGVHLMADDLNSSRW